MSEMVEKGKLSQTMRIDLIPEIPQQPIKGKRKRVVVASPTARFQRDKDADMPVESISDYQSLLQSLYDAVIISNVDGMIVDANARATDFLLYAEDDMRSMNISEVIAGANESLMAQLCENLDDERFTLIEAYCTRSDGTFFPAEIAVNRLNVQGLHLCFFVRDITHRKQAEQMLMTEHNAIQNSSNGIAITDMNAELEYINPAMREMWGYATDEDILGYDIRGLFSDRAVVDEMMIAVAESEARTWYGEMVAVKENGDMFHVQVSVSCNRNADGEEIGMVFSFADISDPGLAEETQRENERHRVMLESLGAACHHLGQPATVLLANLGIIQKRMDGADDLISELVNTSIEAAETLGDILHKLNTFNVYKTTQYLERRDDSDAEENRILDI
ncbi:MAG: PAS domain S-box protein [Kiritimatiellae bacterium]|nr:PAS domain S-box protein [Kiritimatiellia bacterium]